MSTQTKFIQDIRPATKKWTATVSVAEKSMLRIARKNSSKYQHLILVDTQGTRIQATIFDKNIHAFEDTLTVFKKYHITNAHVRPIPPDHRVVNNEYQWIIDGGTMVEEIEREDIAGTSKNTPEFSFVPFSRLDNYIDTFDQVDIIALALDVKPIRCIQTSFGTGSIQEVTVINEEKQPLLLTLWDKFVDNEGAAILNNIATKPVIVAMRLKVVSYNKLSLRTIASTCIMIDPDMPETYALRTWRDENRIYLESTLAEKECLTSSQALTMPINQQIVMINDLQTSAEMKLNHWIKAQILLNDLNQTFWYMACEKCYKKTGADFDTSFHCRQCKSQNVKAIPRCCVQVHLTDSSGVIPATVFGDNAEKFLGCSSKQLMENSTEDGWADIESLANISNSKEYIIRIKSWKQEYAGEEKVKHNVVQLFDSFEIN